MGLPSWLAKVLKTPMVVKFTVEELKILETWVREQGGVKYFCGCGRGSQWPSQGGKYICIWARLVRVGMFVEAHVGEDIWLKERGRLQREPQRSQDGTDGWGGVASPASQAQIPVFPGDHALRGWAYRMKVRCTGARATLS